MTSYYVEPNFFATAFLSIITGFISAIIDNQYNIEEGGTSESMVNKETYASFMIRKMSDIKKKRPYIKASDRFYFASKEWNKYTQGTDIEKENKNKNEDSGKYKFIFRKLCEIRKKNPELKAQERIKIAKKAWHEHSNN